MTASVSALAVRGLAAALLASFLLPGAGAGQLVESVKLQADNDAFNFWIPISTRPDHEYTHGMRLVIEARSARWWRGVAGDRPVCGEAAGAAERCLTTTWELGQRIYTPRVNSPSHIDGERPYAGWLYGAMTANAQNATERHAVRLEVGVTGPQSLAEAFQTTVHRIAGYWEPLGWGDQLTFEPAAMLRYEYARLVARPMSGSTPIAMFAPEASAAVGNLFTGASAGFVARLGYNVPPAWHGEAVESDAPLAVYLTGGAREQLVLRNLFLDGNTFDDGPSVEKEPFVSRYSFGGAVRYRSVEVGYQVVTRSREYRTERGEHRYSSISLTYRH